MNNSESDILLKMRFLNMDQRSDVLHFIDKLKNKNGRSNYRRKAMTQIREALNGQF